MTTNLESIREVYGASSFEQRIQELVDEASADGKSLVVSCGEFSPDQIAAIRVITESDEKIPEPAFTHLCRAVHSIFSISEVNIKREKMSGTLMTPFGHGGLEISWKPREPKGVTP